MSAAEKLKALATPTERSTSSESLAVLMKLSKVPENPGEQSEWQQFAELVGIDQHEGGTAAGEALLEAIGLESVLPEKSERARNDKEIVVGVKIKKTPENIKTITEVLGDFEGSGAAIFRLALMKLLKDKGLA